VDVIDLSLIDANIDVAGDQAFTLVGSPSGNAGELWVVARGGAEYTLYGNVGGGSSAELEITVIAFTPTWVIDF
jgi:hypothetical protein